MVSFVYDVFWVSLSSLIYASRGFTFGLLAPTQFEWGQLDAISFYLALEYWNNGPSNLSSGVIRPISKQMFNNFTISVIPSGCNEQMAFESALSTFISHTPDAIIGCVCSSASIPVGRFSTAFSIPMFLTAAQSSKLSDIASYPYVFRWCTTEVADADLHAGVLKALGVSKATVIYAVADRPTNQKDRLLRNINVAGSNIDVNLVRIPNADYSVPANYELMKNRMKFAWNSSAYVMVMYLDASVGVSNENLMLALDAACENGVLNNFTTALLTETGLSRISATTSGQEVRMAAILDCLGGTIMGRAKPIAERFQAWLQWIGTVNASRLVDNGYSGPVHWLADPTNSFLPWHSFRFEATLALLMVLNDLHESGKALDTSAIQDGIKSLQFHGINGDLAWDSNQDRQGLTYEIFQLQSAELVSIGDMALADNASARIISAKCKFKNAPAGTISLHLEAPACPDGMTKPYPFATASVCFSCERGYYSSGKATNGLCKPCLQGTYSSRNGASRCEVCSLGDFTSSEKATACTRCVQGKFQDKPSSTDCVECAAGSFGNEVGATACQPCPVGSFSSNTSSTLCSVCSTGMTRYRASTSKDACICPEFSHAVGVGDCRPCPEAMTCSLGSDIANFILPFGVDEKPFPEVDVGHWTSRHDRMSVYKCVSQGEGNCPGIVAESCRGGHIGFLCDECPSGRATHDGSCRECSDLNIVAFVVSSLALIPLVCCVHYCSNGLMFVNATADLVILSVIGMLVTLLQIIAMCRALAVPWFKSKPAEAAMSIASPFGKRITIFSSRCIIGYDPVAAYVLEACAPAALCFIALFCFYISKVVAATTRRFQAWEKDQAMNTIGAIYNVLFINFLTLCSYPAAVYSHPNGLMSVTMYPPAIVGEEKHITQMFTSVAVLVVFLLPYMAANLWVSCVAGRRGSRHSRKFGDKERLVVGDSPLVRFRFLFFRFRPSVWWWGNLLFLRQAFLAFAPALPASEPHLQVMFVTVVLIVYATLCAFTQPWKSTILNGLDVALSIWLSVLMLASTAFLTPTEADGDGGIYMYIIGFVLFAALFSLLAAMFIPILQVISRRSCKVPVEYWFSFCTSQDDPQMCDLASAWKKLAEQCALISQDDLEELLLRMPIFDVADVRKSISAWHALGPEVFPQSSPPQKRLRGVEHSASENGYSTSSLVRDVVFRWSKHQARETGTSCSTLINTEQANAQSVDASTSSASPPICKGEPSDSTRTSRSETLDVSETLPPRFIDL